MDGFGEREPPAPPSARQFTEGSLLTALVVIAREPKPGRVKSRLARDTSRDQAAALYRAFILDTLEMCAKVPGATLCLAYTPDHATGVFSTLAGPRFRLIPQGEGDLGDRLHRVCQQLFDEGLEGVIAIGSDSPTLPGTIVRAALRSIRRKDVVLGPCLDGGYYLLGLSRPVPRLFEEIPWGTAGVLGATLGRIEEAGCSLDLLPPWYDVDTTSDLDLLVAHLEGIRQSRSGDLPRHTYAILSGMRAAAERA